MLSRVSRWWTTNARPVRASIVAFHDDSPRASGVPGITRYHRAAQHLHNSSVPSGQERILGRICGTVAQAEGGQRPIRCHVKDVQRVGVHC